MSASDREHLKIFAGSSSESLAEAMCRTLDLPLGKSDPERFPDGEILVRLHEDVRGVQVSTGMTYGLGWRYSF